MADGNWYAVVENATGRLDSVGSKAPVNLRPGFVSLTLASRPDNSTHRWDEVTRTFIARPPVVYLDRLTEIKAHPKAQAVWNVLNAARRQDFEDVLIYAVGGQRMRHPESPLQIEGGWAMTPYYDDGQGIVIYHGEALDVLRTLPTGSVAAVIADPPYSSGGMFRADRQADPVNKYRGWSQNADGSSRPPTSDPGTFSGDSRDQRGYAYWSALWMSQACRVAAPNAQLFVFTDWRQLPTTTDAVQAGGWVRRGILVRDKGVGRPMMGRFRNHLEYIVWASNGPMPDPTTNPVYPSTLLRHAPPGTDRTHVTQKPESLIRELLSVAPPGAMLDPFMGSGTGLRAAKDHNRAATGIELDERYCQIAVQRLQQSVLSFAAVS